MVADEAALILALPGDTADTLLQKIGQAGARRVQVLVPDGAPALQQQAQLERLRLLAERGGVELSLICSDPQTLRAARAGGLVTLQVRGAQVVAPPTAAPGDPYATRVLEREPARGTLPSHLADDLSAGDAAFLDALDDLDAMPPARAGDPAASDEDLFAALEGISTALDRPPARGAASADDDFADALDSIGADEFDMRGDAPVRAPAPAAAPRRIRPEDIELSPAERARATQTGRRGATPPAAPRPARPAPPARRRPRYEEEDEAPAAAPRRQSMLVPVLIILILLVTAAVAALLILGGGATLSVAAPVRPDQLQPVSAMPVPVAAPGGGAGSAIEAEPIASEVAFSLPGRIAEGTMSPSGTARGTITIYSGNAQPIVLPAGSQFIAVKADGQEVPFVSGGEVVVPPATTSDQGAQIITTRGTANVEVTARSAGSASNVDGNSIRRIDVPGGQSFNVDSGTLIVQHGPLGGGSEDQVWIVKDSDVRAALAAGLPGLDAEARRLLDGAAAARGLVFEPTTIIPRQSDLQQLTGFDYTVSPAVGETVDPQNPTFTLTMQARYSALATPADAPLVAPADSPLAGQLGGAFTEQLRQAGLLTPGDCKLSEITGWRWDSERLTVDGQIVPNSGDPACGPGLSDDALARVRDAVRGKPIAEAEAALQALQQQGLIGAYSLPAVERLPGWDFQLKIETR